MTGVRRLVGFTTSGRSIRPRDRMSVAFIAGRHVQRVGERCQSGSQPASIVSFTVRRLNRNRVRLVNTSVPEILKSVVVSITGTGRRTRRCNRSFVERLNFLTIRNFLRLLKCSRRGPRSRGGVFSHRGSVLSRFKLAE